MRRKAFVTAAAVVTALAAVSVAYAGNGGLLPAPAHSPNAHRIRDAYVFVLAFTGGVFLLVEGALIAFIVKYRRGKRARTAEGPQIHGATRLEVIWTVIPVLILVGIGAFVFYKLPGIQDVPKASAANQTRITVEGHQFYWLFRYPNGAVSVNTMTAPANTVVREDVTAPEYDVNHSWWVPELGPKYDAIPGRTNHTWFKAPVGTYVARCAELCGLQHARMEGRVKVVPRAEYDRFLAHRKRTQTGRALGKEEFDGVCMSCHRLNEAYIGPALAGNPLLADRKGLANLLRNGGRRMPPVGKNWTRAQIDALAAYTKKLGSAGGGS